MGSNVGQFLQALGKFHAKNPLPPRLLGIQNAQNYDLASSPFRDLQLGPEPATISIAGKPINIFILFSAVLARGGSTTVCPHPPFISPNWRCSQLTANNAWHTLLPQFGLQNEQHHTLDGSLVSVSNLLRHHYNLIFVPFEEIYLRNMQEKSQAMRQINASQPPPRGLSNPNPPFPQGPQTVSLPRNSSVDPTSADTDQDHSMKRKLEFDESDGKRARQKTGAFYFIFFQASRLYTFSNRTIWSWFRKPVLFPSM